MAEVSSWVNAAIREPSGRRWMPSSAIFTQSTPFLAWMRISSIASSRLATSRPIDVEGAPIQLGYQSVRLWRAEM